ncbi:fumarylacetoacetate hydrolase family protein [Nocardioides sp. YIM B13467]|uniref:fumarylacetoacetate hydrolase family protein n=1 Tax=Nocardioides sp. YIM B13467 TaxID=3366294 RepID=UPI00366F8BAF
MRLLSVGPPGEERPAALDDEDVLRDLSAIAPAIDGDLLGDPVRLRLIQDLIALGNLPIVADGTRIGPPVARPGKVVGIGLNYEDHAEEAGVAIPDEPVVFLKPSTSVVGPHDAIELPPGSTMTDYEVELGVVIGRRACRGSGAGPRCER